MKYLTLFAAISILVLGCGKYDEGPEISFRPKKTRLIGTWKPENSVYYLQIKENNFFCEYINDNGVARSNLCGGWIFKNNKKEIRLIYGFEPQESGLAIYRPDRTLDILKLTRDELWLTDNDTVKYTKISNRKSP